MSLGRGAGIFEEFINPKRAKLFGTYGIRFREIAGQLESLKTFSEGYGSPTSEHINEALTALGKIDLPSLVKTITELQAEINSFWKDQQEQKNMERHNEAARLRNSSR